MNIFSLHSVIAGWDGSTFTGAKTLMALNKTVKEPIMCSIRSGNMTVCLSFFLNMRLGYM